MISKHNLLKGLHMTCIKQTSQLKAYIFALLMKTITTENMHQPYNVQSAMMVPSSFDLIIRGTDDSPMNIIIYKKYILFKANLKHKYDVDSPWHWLHLELCRCSRHSSAILSQGCNFNFVKSRCIFPNHKLYRHEIWHTCSCGLPVSASSYLQ